MYLPACNISSQLSIVPRILENSQKKKKKEIIPNQERA